MNLWGQNMQWVHILSNIWQCWISEFLLIKFVLFPLLNPEGRAIVYLLLRSQCQVKEPIYKPSTSEENDYAWFWKRNAPHGKAHLANHWAEILGLLGPERPLCLWAFLWERVARAWYHLTGSPTPIKLTIKLTTKQALFKTCSLFNRVRFLRTEIIKNALRGHYEEQKDK